MSVRQELMAEYDSEEGYPADAWIDRFEALPRNAFDFREAAHFLISDLPNIAKTISCMTVKVADGIEPGIKAVEFHTGGWSGAESLIDVMLRQYAIKQLHHSWQRGGHFYFQVPGRFLDGAIA